MQKAAHFMCTLEIQQSLFTVMQTKQYLSRITAYMQGLSQKMFLVSWCMLCQQFHQIELLEGSNALKIAKWNTYCTVKASSELQALPLEKKLLHLETGIEIYLVALMELSRVQNCLTKQCLWDCCIRTINPFLFLYTFPKQVMGNQDVCFLCCLSDEILRGAEHLEQVS